MYLVDTEVYPLEQTVGRVLQGIPDDTDIKVGCEHGSGYIWFGKAGDFYKSLDDIDQKIIRDASNKIAFWGIEKIHCMKRITTRQLDIQKRIISIADYITKYIPLTKRGVVEQYRSTYEKRLIIILQGYESGECWDYNEWTGKKAKPIDLTNVHDDVIKNLMNEVYKSAFDDLKSIYKGKHHDAESADALEKFFMHDPYSYMGKTTGATIIAEARRQAKSKKHDRRENNGKQKAEKGDVKTGEKKPKDNR